MRVSEPSVGLSGGHSRRCSFVIPLTALLLAAVACVLTPYSVAQITPPEDDNKSGDGFPEAEGRWREYVSERYYEAEVSGTLMNQSVDFTHRSNSLDSVVSWGREVLDIESKMGAALEKVLRTAVDGVTVRNYSFSASGNPSISLSMSQGILKVTLGGISIRASAKLKYNSWISQKIRLATSTVWLTGTFDVVNGVANFSLPSDFTIDINTSPNFKFPVNVIGAIVGTPVCTILIAGKEKSTKLAKLCFELAAEVLLPISTGSLNSFLENLVSQAISSQSSADYMFYGVEDAFSSVELKPNQVANLTQDARDLLTIANGKSVSLTVSETYQNLGLDSGRRSCRSNLSWVYTAPVVVSIISVELSFPSVSLTIRNGVDTDYVWECDGKCVQGGGTVPANCPVTPKPST